MSFYVVAVFEDQGVVELKQFEKLEELTGYMTKVLKSGAVKTYAFDGKRLKVSRPPFRYLMVDDQKHPLFALPDSIEEDPEFGSSTKEVEETPIDDAYQDITNEVFKESESAEEDAPALPTLEDMSEPEFQEDDELD